MCVASWSRTVFPSAEVSRRREAVHLLAFSMREDVFLDAMSVHSRDGVS